MATLTFSSNEQRDQVVVGAQSHLQTGSDKADGAGKEKNELVASMRGLLVRSTFATDAF